jgi:hypothetical protein
MQKYINLQKNPLKETKSFQDIITLELISSFNTSPKLSSFKNPHWKIYRPIIIIIIIIITTITYRNHTWSYLSAKTMLEIRTEVHSHLMLSPF